MRLVLDLGRETARIVLCSPCVVCGSELPWFSRRSSCCNSCWKNLPRLPDSRCARCAFPFAAGGLQDALCVRCVDQSSTLEWVDAWGPYDGGVDRLLQSFKFARHDFLAGPLSELLVDVWKRRADHDFDQIVAVPMFPAKKRRRGFNQAELLAREFSRRTGRVHRSAHLQQRAEGATQSSLPRKERAANVRGLYQASPRVAGRSILLIDDICTTGATLQACADALTAAGARRVCALVVARVS